MRGSIAVPGRNCWRRPRARRVALLVDGAAYFDAFAAAVERARRSILIVGWDIHSRIRLRRDGVPRPWPEQLGDFLNAVVSRRPELHANVLGWDFAMIFALEREVLPLFNLGWRTHRRLHFRLDGDHPPGASHHQKIVVVDDAVAFVGGLDLAACRWDTPAHRANDPRRADAGYAPHAPFHDVQALVDGDAAAALAALVRERWARATGRRLAPVGAVGDPWPPGVVPDLAGVDVAVARTDPAWNGRPEVREVEALYLDAIAAARSSIYLETQYFTSGRIAAALAARLREPHGPEVVLVAPLHCSGWLEERTMGVVRGRLLHALRAADRHGRLRACYPALPGLEGRGLLVHSKVMIVDDVHLRVGSANLSNRSMSLDTECDLAVDAAGDPRTAAGIAGFRNRLLGEHLGAAPARVDAALRAHGSLVAAVDALAGGPRTLRVLEPPPPSLMDDLVPAAAIADPERPVDLDCLVEALLPDDVPSPARHVAVYAVAVLAGLGALTAAWWWTPLGGWLETLVAAARPLRARPEAGALVALAAFVLGSLAFLPATVLIFLCGLTFGAPWGFTYALVGSVVGATVVYAIGGALPRDAVRMVAGSALNRLSRRLTHRGVVAVARLRLTPVAPFTVANLVAGASRVRFRDFVLGTLVALAPGSLALCVVADQFGAAVRSPDGLRLAGLAAAAMFLVVTAPSVRALLRTAAEDRPGG
jgi:phosphatidylserine/phosphatidylglycerophosphate/cardiolipin synthase-like enzyme/uncharacterized membrane protein YdjX (TVP38/TMEM64 family)